MSQAERLYKIKHWLDAGRCLGVSTLHQQLGVSLATLKRDIAHLRQRMNFAGVDLLHPAPSNLTRAPNPAASTAWQRA